MLTAVSFDSDYLLRREPARGMSGAALAPRPDRLLLRLNAIIYLPSYFCARRAARQRRLDRWFLKATSRLFAAQLDVVDAHFCHVVFARWSSYQGSCRARAMFFIISRRLAHAHHLGRLLVRPRPAKPLIPWDVPPGAHGHHHAITHEISRTLLVGCAISLGTGTTLMRCRQRAFYASRRRPPYRGRDAVATRSPRCRRAYITIEGGHRLRQFLAGAHRRRAHGAVLCWHSSPARTGALGHRRRGQRCRVGIIVSGFSRTRPHFLALATDIRFARTP